MTDSSALRAAVIGLGRMGMHHVRACVDTHGIDLVAILDHKPDWAVQIAAETQSLVAADVDSLFGKVDFAIVAVPTTDHASTSIPLLNHGISCLVEKPIAGTEADAEAMIEAANRSGAQLQVGHIERFNPVIDQLRKEVERAVPIRRIEVQRHNAPVDRDYDIDAVLDLMIHDLDLLSMFTGMEPSTVSVHESSSDHRVEAHLVFSDGLTVDLSVDRQADQPARMMRLEMEDVAYVVDYSTQSLSRHTSSGAETIPVTTGDALRRQLISFSQALQTGSVSGTSGDDALRALKLANLIRAEAGLMA